MKTFEVNALGLEEMSIQEARQTDGGFWPILALILLGVTVNICSNNGANNGNSGDGNGSGNAADSTQVAKNR